MPEREPSFLGGGAAPIRPHGAEVGARPGAVGGGAAPRATASVGPAFHAAGFFRRLGGGFIDLAIIAPVALLFTWLGGRLTGIHLPPSRYRSLDFWLDLLLASDPALLGGLGLTIAIALAYALVFQVATGGTPGMRATRIRIIDLYGDDPSVGRVAFRTLGYLAGVVTLGLGFLWIAFDSEKRGLHDYLAGTFVVKA